MSATSWFSKAPVVPPNGVVRSVAVITERLEEERLVLEGLERDQKALPGRIKRKETKIAKMQAIANDRRNGYWRTNEHQLAQKEGPELADLKQKRDDGPKLIKEATNNIKKLEKELEVAKAREEARAAKAANTAKATTAPTTRAGSKNATTNKKRKAESDGPASCNKSQKKDGQPPSSLTTSRSAGTGKKRKASEDDGGESSKRQKPNLPGSDNDGQAGQSSRRKASTKPLRKLNGLANHGNACFANSAIQFLDAAFEGQNLDELLGEVDDNLEEFGMGKEWPEKLNRKIRGRRPAKEAGFKKAVKEAAKAGETEKVSVARHLRSLLEDLHAQDLGENEYVSPYLFQSVFAYGATEGDATARETMSGATQEDSHEYYQAVLNALASDEHTQDAETLKNLFEIQMEEIDACSNPNCDYKSRARASSGNYHAMEVPAPKKGKACKFSELIEESLRSETDRGCTRCNEGQLIIQKRFKETGDNLVLHMGRFHFDKSTKRLSKVKTAVQLDHHTLEFNCGKYQLTAVVYHAGERVQSGHYTMCRKHGKNWYDLDDKTCSKIAKADVKDTKKGGESAMLLLKKIKA